MMPRLRSATGINEGAVPTTPADLCRHLGGRKVGRQWAACCPAHKDREPSLSIGWGNNGGIVVRCFAGCTQDAVIGALRDRRLWANGHASRLIRPQQYRVREKRDDSKNELVNRIWNEAGDPQGTA